MSTSDDLDFGQTIRGFVDGQLVFGRFTLQRMLGRGGMGIVWLAHDEKLNCRVALKFLPELVATDPVAIDDLKRETLRCLALTHPGIVRIHDFVDGGGSPAISMEFVDGRTLSAWRIERENRVFEAAELLPWMASVCEALTYAHERARVVHRDLKPSNLMLSTKGEIKVADFGIARSISDSASRFSAPSSATSGTLVYMSPQQLAGKASSASDDVYSLGATIYELLTGKPPFYSGNIQHQVESVDAPSMTERRAELRVADAQPIPDHWEQTVAACLAKNPPDRPQSVAEVAERLRGDSARAISRKTFSTQPALAKTLSINWALVALVIVAVLGIMGAIWLTGKNAPHGTAAQPMPTAAPTPLRDLKAEAEAEKRAAERRIAAAETARIAEARGTLIAQTLAAAREAGQAGDWNRMDALIGNVLSLDPANAGANQLRGEVKAARQLRSITQAPIPTPAAVLAPTPDPRWLFPDSDRRYLRPGDLSRMDKDTLWRARNEIYVRLGYIFLSERGRLFAKSFGASYVPRISGEDAISRVFNPYESANVDMIKKYEDAR